MDILLCILCLLLQIHYLTIHFIFFLEYLFNTFKKQIKGFIGIGSAPEFLEKLMWKKFNKKVKSEIKNKGICLIKNGGYEYPITYQLIKDGKKNKVLSKKIYSKINDVDQLNYFLDKAKKTAKSKDQIFWIVRDLINISLFENSINLSCLLYTSPSPRD